MQFEYYVMNWEFNRRELEQFNIFWNSRVQNETEQAVKRYLRAPGKFKYQGWRDEEPIVGFDGFVRELDRIIRGEEWSRCEYEIMVGSLFGKEDEMVKIDCYEQCRKNMPMIAREVIYQYKQQLQKSATGDGDDENNN